MPKLLPIVPILMIAFSFFEVKDVTMLFGDGKASERIAMIRKRLVKGIVLMFRLKQYRHTFCVELYLS